MVHRQSFADLRLLYGRGALSPVEVARSALAHAEQVGARTNAFALLDGERALSAAATSEDRWRKGEALSPLDGMPVTVKDFAAVAGWPTRRGSRTTSGAPSTETAIFAERLLAAGAVILGKTRAPEFNWKGVTDSPAFGITRNPWNLSLTPGGSSGGCAAAVAAGVVRISFGSDAGGSVRIPAAFCGTLGLKPSFGLIPMAPLPSHFSGTAHIGVLGAASDDVLDALRIAGGRTPHDWTSADAPDLYAATMPPVAGLRIGLLARERWADGHAENEAAIDMVAQALGDGGFHIRAVDFDVHAASAVGRSLYEIACSAIVKGIPEAQRALLDPGLTDFARAADGMSLADYLDVLRRRDVCGNALAALFEEIDVLMLPTVPIAPFAAGMNVPPGSRHQNWFSWNPYTPAFNASQAPALSFPIWLPVQELPASVQFAARRLDDRRLLQLGAWLEERLPRAALFRHAL